MKSNQTSSTETWLTEMTKQGGGHDPDRVFRENINENIRLKQTPSELIALHESLSRMTTEAATIAKRLIKQYVRDTLLPSYATITEAARRSPTSDSLKNIPDDATLNALGSIAKSVSKGMHGVGHAAKSNQVDKIIILIKQSKEEVLKKLGAYKEQDILGDLQKQFPDQKYTNLHASEKHSIAEMSNHEIMHWLKYTHTLQKGTKTEEVNKLFTKAISSALQEQSKGISQKIFASNLISLHNRLQQLTNSKDKHERELATMAARTVKHEVRYLLSLLVEGNVNVEINEKEIDQLAAIAKSVSGKSGASPRAQVVEDYAKAAKKKDNPL